MPYQKEYKTSHTTQLSLKGKLKSASKISSAMRHNNRIGREGSGAHIDKRRQYLNRDLLSGKGPDDIYLDIMNRVTGETYTSETVPRYGEGDAIYYQDGTKLRQGQGSDKKSTYDAVLAFETEARYPGDMVWSTFDKSGKIIPVPDEEVIDDVAIAPLGKDVILDDKTIGKGKGYFLYPKDIKEFDAWCDATFEFQKKRFGERNILSAMVHMDEGTPHIHTICSPFVKDAAGLEKLSYSKIIGGKSGFFDMQDGYADAVAHLGYKRGEVASPHISRISTKEYKYGLSKVMNAEYPKDLDNAKQEIKDLRIKNYDLKTQMEETMHSAKTIQKLRVTRHDLSEENKELKEKLERQRRENEQLRRVIEVMERRKQFEEKGRELHENREAAQVYQQLQEQYLEMGTQYYKDLGYNVDLKYYEDRNHDGINDRNQFIDENQNGVDDRYE